MDFVRKTKKNEVGVKGAAVALPICIDCADIFCREIRLRGNKRRMKQENCMYDAVKPLKYVFCKTLFFTVIIVKSDIERIAEV